jgi:drug/metabolite transporter (DMT)-like permease
MTPYQKGLLITCFGGLVLTIDIPMIRLGGGDVWSAQITRSSLSFLAAIVCWLVISLWRGKPMRLVPGRDGMLVAMFYGLSAIAFIAAIYNTSTANLVFILTTITIFSALLGWFFLGERPKPITMWTMLVMILAILAIVSDSLESGNLFGDLCALAAAFTLSVAQTIARKSGQDMGFAPMLGAILPAVVAAFVLASSGGLAAFHLDAPIWTILNGAVVIPVAFWCLATGPKYLTGAEVGMFYLLETVLAPVWVWFIFAEVPSTTALIAGTILVGALLIHSLWQLKSEMRSTQSL